MITAFVYGTLRRGEANDIGLAAARHGIEAPVLLGSATVRGTLYDFGAYPGLLPDANGTAVVGDVYRIEAALVPVLDEIEAVYPGQEGLFLRRQVVLDVRTQDGSLTLDCLYYPVAAASVAGLLAIAGGDWVAHRRMRAA